MNIHTQTQVYMFLDAVNLLVTRSMLVNLATSLEDLKNTAASKEADPAVLTMLLLSIRTQAVDLCWILRTQWFHTGLQTNSA